MKNIAVLITCFNRKDKTIDCIHHLYNQNGMENIKLDIFVVDGGSKDGTPEAIVETFPKVFVRVNPGLYWAGGMRAAWKLALQQGEYDFYWLINDDTLLYENCLLECLKADDYCMRTYQKQGIYIGSTQDPITKTLSYGGMTEDETWVIPNGKDYATCELGNANIMLVSNEVFHKIGGLSEVYTHGIADYDYTLRASRAGYPVLVLPTFVGACQDDHGTPWLSQTTSLKKRIDYLYSPKGLAYKEYITYYRTFYPNKVLSIKCKLWLKTLFPFLWKLLKK